MKNIIQSLRALIFFSILTGLVYPLLINVAAQTFFAKKAGGSLVYKNNKLSASVSTSSAPVESSGPNRAIVIGSSLIGQKFSKPEYFWGRPSASDFGTLPSGASNLGPTSQDLKKQIVDRREQLAKAFRVDPSEIPQDLLTSSASGVDPHISVAAAKIQAGRIVKARRLTPDLQKRMLARIDTLTEKPIFGLFGESRVNVLALNLNLDEEYGFGGQ